MLEALTHQLQRLGRQTFPRWNGDCDAEIDGERREVTERINALEMKVEVLEERLDDLTARLEDRKARR